MKIISVEKEAEPPDQCRSSDEEDRPPSSLNQFNNTSIIEMKSFEGVKVASGDLFQARSSLTREILFPEATDKEWNDWRWQLRNSFKTLPMLDRVLCLSEHEKAAGHGCSKALPISVTPYYMTLVDPWDPSDPIRRAVIPTIYESVVSQEEQEDPLGEEDDSPVPGLIHRYPDRVLLLATNRCSVYCRYCTRSRVVGQKLPDSSLAARLAGCIQYIAEHPEIRDVLVSGGDPLLLSDNLLDSLLGRLQKIPHVEIVRLGTKVPVVLPQRITQSLVRVLKRHHPLWMNIHFTHPRELTEETTKACARLADAGIPLGSQTVLLNGVNDDVHTMTALCQGLVKRRVRPYYLYQCDRIKGSAHFTTPVVKGLEIIKGLRGFTTGMAVPTYVIDAPGGGGKIPLLPQYYLGSDENGISLRSYSGRIHTYPDHISEIPCQEVPSLNQGEIYV